MGSLEIIPGLLDSKSPLLMPPSKSHTLRAMVLATMAKGTSQIDRYLPSPDTHQMLCAIEQLGARCVCTEQVLHITGTGGLLQPSHHTIDAGNSGQVLRFIGGLVSLLPTSTILTGDHSLQTRRLSQPLIHGIRQLGGTAMSLRIDGYAPFRIQGPIHPGHAKLDGQDSQPVSALLIATSFLPGPSTIEVTTPRETPWIDLTMAWLRSIGVTVQHTHYTHFHVPGYASPDAFQVRISGDFSAAAFPLTAAIVGRTQVALRNLDMGDVQGDKHILSTLRAMGATIDIDPIQETVQIHQSTLRGIDIDADLMIDAVPILAVLGCYAEGKTRIFRAGPARKKESDRLAAISAELRTMGAQIEEYPDALHISSSALKGGDLFSYNDHRIAMALAVAALGAKGKSRIRDATCIAKSYPQFVLHMQQMGANIRWTP